MPGHGASDAFFRARQDQHSARLFLATQKLKNALPIGQGGRVGDRVCGQSPLKMRLASEKPEGRQQQQPGKSLNRQQQRLAEWIRAKQRPFEAHAKRPARSSQRRLGRRDYRSIAIGRPARHGFHVSDPSVSAGTKPARAGHSMTASSGSNKLRKQGQGRLAPGQAGPELPICRCPPGPTRRMIKTSEAMAWVQIPGAGRFHAHVTAEPAGSG